MQSKRFHFNIHSIIKIFAIDEIFNTFLNKISEI